MDAKEKKQLRLAKTRLTSENEILYERKILETPNTIHWHDFYELDIILSGKAKSMVNGRKCDCRAGDIEFMTPSDVHDYAGGTLEIFNIHFTEESVDSALLHHLILLNSRTVRLPKEDVENIRKLCRLFETAKMDSVYRKQYNRRILECILLLYMQNVSDSERNIRKTRPKLIQEIVIYVNAHFAENPTLKEIAKTFHLNENYLCSLFKEYMGEGYKSYLRKMKLEHAKKLISYTDLSITEVALNSGYNTQSHFNREFQKMYQMTPLEMRKNL